MHRLSFKADVTRGHGRIVLGPFRGSVGQRERACDVHETDRQHPGSLSLGRVPPAVHVLRGVPGPHVLRLLHLAGRRSASCAQVCHRSMRL